MKIADPHISGSDGDDTVADELDHRYDVYIYIYERTIIIVMVIIMKATMIAREV